MQTLVQVVKIDDLVGFRIVCANAEEVSRF